MKKTVITSAQQRSIQRKSVGGRRFGLKSNKWKTKAALILGLTNVKQYKNPKILQETLPCKKSPQRVLLICYSASCACLKQLICPITDDKAIARLKHLSATVLTSKQGITFCFKSAFRAINAAARTKVHIYLGKSFIPGTETDKEHFQKHLFASQNKRKSWGWDFRKQHLDPSNTTHCDDSLDLNTNHGCVSFISALLYEMELFMNEGKLNYDDLLEDLNAALDFYYLPFLHYKRINRLTLSSGGSLEKRRFLYNINPILYFNIFNTRDLRSCIWSQYRNETQYPLSYDLIFIPYVTKKMLNHIDFDSCIVLDDIRFPFPRFT